MNEADPVSSVDAAPSNIDVDEDWQVALEAAASRKAENPIVLHIGAVSSFTDHFLLLTGNNQRQTLAIAEAIETSLKAHGVRAIGIEGRQSGEWILMDYGDFVVHVFSPEKREFYDLERLWKSAPRLPLPEAA